MTDASHTSGASTANGAVETDTDARKKVLRRHCRRLRHNLSDHQRHAEQRSLDAQMVALCERSDYASYAVYAATADECSCDALCRHLWARGRVVYMPKVSGTRQLTWHAVAAATDLARGFQGIREPLTDVCAFPVSCCVFVPGLAFGRQGQRLGMGGGFYDALLAKMAKTAEMSQTAGDSLSVGVAWSCQMQDDIPMDAHDQMLMRVLVADTDLNTDLDTGLDTE